MIRTAFVAGLCFISLAAAAHDAAQWIQDGRYHSAGGSLCCGEKDCAELADSDVTATEGGYFVKSLRELVPYSEAQPSPDGKFWRCAWPKIEDRKCFFSPPPSM